MKYAILLLLVPALAHADPELGTPLPQPSAEPALAGVSPFVASADADYVPALPAIDLGHGVTSPRRSATLGGLSLATYAGSRHMGWFGTYSSTFSFGFGDTITMLGVTPLAAGIGYRHTGWLVGAQLGPRVEWYLAHEQSAGMSLSGRDHVYAVEADVQACVEYSIGRIFPRNSAACVYVAPMIYRQGWFQGGAIGLRLFAL